MPRSNLWRDSNPPLKAAVGFDGLDDGVLLVQELLGGRHLEPVDDDLQGHLADACAGGCAADDRGQRPRALGNSGSNKTFG